MQRILIVDDNRQNVRLLTDILESQGFNVDTAYSGATGLELAYKNNPDLILMDVQMPNMSGTEAMRTLKTNGIMRKTPVLAVTALAMNGDEDELLSAGFDGYVSKPISFMGLLAAVKKFLNQT